MVQETFKKKKDINYTGLKTQGKDLEPTQYPEHYQAFVSCKIQRQYIVNLDEKGYADLVKRENLWDFKQFTKYFCQEKGVDVKFMMTKSLPHDAKHGNSDYMIFDDNVIIQWDPNTDGGVISTAIIVTLLDIIVVPRSVPSDGVTATFHVFPALSS